MNNTEYVYDVIRVIIMIRSLRSPSLYDLIEYYIYFFRVTVYVMRIINWAKAVRRNRVQ